MRRPATVEGSSGTPTMASEPMRTTWTGSRRGTQLASIRAPRSRSCLARFTVGSSCGGSSLVAMEKRPKTFAGA